MNEIKEYIKKSSEHLWSATNKDIGYGRCGIEVKVITIRADADLGA
jgi:hypothetical protein